MDALKAVKPEKCKTCLSHFKTEDISKLSGLKASVLGRTGNLLCICATFFNKHRTTAEVKTAASVHERNCCVFYSS